jgi:dihydroorotate dehydrogenase (NAD+) catalytic subunit
MTAEDALEFLVTGATAVQVGTANFVNPRATIEIIDGIKAFLTKHGISSVMDIVGTLET